MFVLSAFVFSTSFLNYISGGHHVGEICVYDHLSSDLYRVVKFQLQIMVLLEEVVEKVQVKGQVK